MKTGFSKTSGFDGDLFMNMRLENTARACASKELRALIDERVRLTGEQRWTEAHEERYVERLLACVDLLSAPPVLHS